MNQLALQRQPNTDANMTYQEIADALNMPLSTVKHTEKVALKRIRRYLARAGLPASVMVPMLRSL